MTATVLEIPMNDFVTLSHRLAEGPISLQEALRYATNLAEALRQIHDTGRTYGTLSPSSIILTAGGLELAATGGPASVTPYTAPEILRGRPADQRSDIFAFGAIVYEMIMGRRAFAGDNADALAVALTISVPPPTGEPAVDHLIGNCIAKDPAVRCPRMQKVILELKILTFGFWHGAHGSVVTPAGGDGRGAPPKPSNWSSTSPPLVESSRRPSQSCRRPARRPLRLSFATRWSALRSELAAAPGTGGDRGTRRRRPRNRRIRAEPSTKPVPPGSR